jgi:hypothetical protein
MVVELLNWYTFAVFLACVVVVWQYYRLTRAKGIMLLLFAYLWTALVRAGISFDIPFLNDNSRPLTAVTATLHFIGLVLLMWALRKFYHGGQSAVERDERADTREQAADVREYEADNRERVADVRDEAADKREGENDG